MNKMTSLTGALTLLLAAGWAVATGRAEGPDAARALADAQKEQDKAEVRESVITASKIEFDNKEGVILFEGNVLVEDEQFQMRADRLLVFMEGTNEVQQIMAINRVSITNVNRAATCDRAVYTREDGKIVMSGNARLLQIGRDAGEVTGDRITIWLNDERMEVSPGRVVLPPGTFNRADRRLLP